MEVEAEFGIKFKWSRELLRR